MNLPVKVINNRINTVFNPNFTSNEWRIEMWDATTHLLNDKPLTGVGAGNWKIAVYPYYSEYLPSVYRHWRNPHNDYLLTLSEKGIPGLIPFVGMFLLLIYYGTRNMLRTSSFTELLSNSFFVFGILGYVVISFFSFPSERINHLIFISLMAAFIITEYVKDKDVSEGKSVSKTLIVVPMLILSYIVIHFGAIAVHGELNIARAESAKEKQDWARMEKYAQKAYSPLLPIEPKFSFPASMFLGIPNYHKGDFENALGYFKRSYHQHPTNISVMNNIGSVYGQMGMLDSSIVYHQKSLEIFPHYEIGLINLSKAFYLKEDFVNAYQTILRCDPRSQTQEVHRLRSAIESKIDQ